MPDRLREIRHARQHPDSTLRRRWFTSPRADLYVWEDDDGIAALELCYGKPHDEHALGWSRQAGFRHARIDDGEGSAFEHRTPIAVAGGHYDRDAIALVLEELGAHIDPRTYRRVLGILHLGR